MRKPYWENLTTEEKQKIYNCYIGIKSEIIRKDIEELYGAENLNSFNSV